MAEETDLQAQQRVVYERSRKQVLEEREYQFRQDSRKQALNLASREGCADQKGCLEVAQAYYDWLTDIKIPE